MRLRRWTIITGALFFGSMISLAWLAWPKGISETEATRLAEQFIVANGYTDLPADRSQLSAEPVIYASGLEDELKHRQGQLERKADGTYRSEGGWLVYFRYQQKTAADAETRRVVVMDLKGNYIHLMHQDAY